MEQEDKQLRGYCDLQLKRRLKGTLSSQLVRPVGSCDPPRKQPGKSNNQIIAVHTRARLTARSTVERGREGWWEVSWNE